MGNSGSNHGQATITEEVVKEICTELLYANKSITLQNIADKFGVSRDVVKHIYAGNSWKNISMQYVPFPKRTRAIKKKGSK